MLILLKVRYVSACGAILVNDTLDLNEDSYHTFISPIKHYIYKSDKGILDRYEYIYSYRTPSVCNLTNILDTIVFQNYGTTIWHKCKAKIEFCSGKEFLRRDIEQ